MSKPLGRRFEGPLNQKLWDARVHVVTRSLLGRRVDVLHVLAHGIGFEQCEVKIQESAVAFNCRFVGVDIDTSVLCKLTPILPPHPITINSTTS